MNKNEIMLVTLPRKMKTRLDSLLSGLVLDLPNSMVPTIRMGFRKIIVKLQQMLDRNSNVRRRKRAKELRLRRHK